MLSNDTRRKIENITKGIVIEGALDNCTSIRNFLSGRFPTSTAVKKDFENQSIAKKEQERLIDVYCSEQNLWITQLPGNERYLTRGGEAVVYLLDDGLHVIKLNDAVYYATWLEFLNSILLHNIIFENTAYSLLGFTKKENVLYAVLQQTFVQCDAQADLEEIKKFLEFNGFKNVRRQDYANYELGLLLEDMHDENVLVRQQTLFFIDTVFYTVNPEAIR